VFSEKWADSVVYLQSLALIAVFRTFYLFHGSLFLIFKVPNIITKKELVSSVISLLIIIILGGEIGAAAGVFAIGTYTFLSFLWNSLAVNEVIKYPLKQFLKDFTPAFTMSAIMALIVYFTSISTLVEDEKTRLILCLFVGAIAYIAMLCLVEKDNVKKLYHSRFKNEKNNIVSPK
jgi:O-antigen/teichoic acid export membrane protein